VVIAPGPSALTRHLLTIAPSIVEQFFRNRSPTEFLRSCFHRLAPPAKAHTHYSESQLLIHTIYSLPLTTCQIGVSIRLTMNCYTHFGLFGFWPRCNQGIDQ
jgi:hypothetical protein